MEKQDARKLEPAAQYELRKQVIRAWKRGRNRVQISEEIGLSYVAVCNIVKRYRMSEDKSFSALAPARRGRREGESRTLTAEQEELIQRLICEKRPEQLKMVFALWSRAAVMQLVEHECGIKLSVRGIGNYLKRWGFTPQKPIKKAYEQRPEAVKA
jgi:transposase